MKKCRRKMVRLSLIIALLLALVGITVTTYAYYWDSTSTERGETITIGSGQEVVVVPVQLKPEEALVPTEITPDDTETTSVVLTYNVDLNKVETLDKSLSVVAEDVTINNETTYAGLVNVDIVLASTDVNKDKVVLVTVTVTLDAPQNVEEYNAIKGQNIKFNLVFSVA